MEQKREKVCISQAELFVYRPYLLVNGKHSLFRPTPFLVAQSHLLFLFLASSSQ